MQQTLIQCVSGRRRSWLARSLLGLAPGLALTVVAQVPGPGGVVPGAHLAVQADDLLAGCRGCHAAVSLAGRPPDVLAAAIRAIIAGELAHPVPVAPLDAGEIAALAEALAGP